MENDDKRRVNVRGIIYRDGKIFAQKLTAKDGTSGETAYWCVPGGGLDRREGLETGLVREFIEETGVTPQVGRLLFIQQFPSDRAGRDEELELFFLIDNVDDFDEIDLSKTSHGVAEIARYGFIDPKKEHLLPKFLCDIDLIDYCENIRPVYVAYNFPKDDA